MPTRTINFIATIILALSTPCLGNQLIPNMDSGHENQAGLVFSPDGEQAFWAAWNGEWGGDTTSAFTILTSKHSNTGWSKPEPMPFSGAFSDNDPFVAPDGDWLYFVSDRPAPGQSGEQAPNADIWRYHLREPHQLEYLSVNSPAVEYSPVMTDSGTLYFASDREGGQGRGDLYRALPQADGFAPAEALGPAVNTPTGEWNLWVSADETDMIFEASSRPTNLSTPGDLYYSRNTQSGWTAAIPIKLLNSQDSDLLGRLHPDGTCFFYTTAPIGGNAHIASVNWPDLKAELDTYQQY